MAHYAFLDANNIVTEVITGKNEWEDGIDWEKFYGEFRGQKCIRTSYNGNIRNKYAGIGDIYDEERDIFVSPKPFNSWILNEETYSWEAPVPIPDTENIYKWNENELKWDLVENLNTQEQ